MSVDSLKTERSDEPKHITVNYVKVMVRYLICSAKFTGLKTGEKLKDSTIQYLTIVLRYVLFFLAKTK